MNNTDHNCPKWLMVLKHTIRPILTYLFTILYMYTYVNSNYIDPVFVGGLNNIMLTIIVFWFGERLLRNIGISEYLNKDNKLT